MRDKYFGLPSHRQRLSMYPRRTTRTLLYRTEIAIRRRRKTARVYKSEIDGESECYIGQRLGATK